MLKLLRDSLNCFAAACICLSLNVAAQQPTKFSVKPCWNIDLEFKSDTPSVANKEAVFIAVREGALIAVDSNHGEILWRAELGGEITGKLIATDSQLFVVTRLESTEPTGAVSFRLHALSSLTGLTLWRNILQSLPIPVTESAGRLIVFFENGSIQALDAQSGQHVLETSFRKKISAVTFSRGRLGIVFNGEKQIAVVDQTLSAATFVSTTISAKQIIAIDHGMLIISDGLGNLASYSPDGENLLWRTQVGAEISSLVETPRGIIVTSFDNFVYLFSNSGRKIWKRRLAGRTVGAPLVASETVMLATYDGDTAYALDLKKGRIVSQIILEGGNLFVSNPLLSGNAFVFTTRRGITVYSKENCSVK